MIGPDVPALLRWLADQVEADRAREVEIQISAPAPYDSTASIVVRVHSLDRPPSRVLVRPSPTATIAPEHRHARDDHHGDGPCLACEPVKLFAVGDDGATTAVLTAQEEAAAALLVDQLGHVHKDRSGRACDRNGCGPRCRSAKPYRPHWRTEP